MRATSSPQRFIIMLFVSSPCVFSHAILSLYHSRFFTMQNVYHIALKELGVQERAGADHNPRILEYHQATSLKATSDEVPWCAAFVNWCLREAGFQGTNSARARSFLAWGESVAINDIKPGDIVVFSRGNNPILGHVAFFHSWKNKRTGIMTVCGGNQSNSVSLSRYSLENLIGIRRATTKPFQA